MEPNLEWLLNYEVRISKRYRRFMSIVLVAPGEKTNGTLRGILKDSFRDCDAFLQVNGFTAIIMSETGRDGGLSAIQRCRVRLNPAAAAFSLVTFPYDGSATDALMDRAQDRLLRACRGEAAGVVSEG